MTQRFQNALRNRPVSDDGVSNTDCFNEITRIIRNTMHLQQVEMGANNYEQRNRSLRVKYLRNEINEDKLKSLLQQAEKQHNKRTEMKDVYRTVGIATGDILNRFLHHIQTNGTIEARHRKWSYAILNELKDLRIYANECLDDIKYTYGGVGRKFDNSFSIN
jgi:hypothetical protein